MTQRNLVGLSRQVLYEFEMIEFLAKRLADLEVGPQPAWRERFQTPVPLVRDRFEYNAMLESLLVHARALTAFVFDPAPKRDREESRIRRPRAGKLHDGFAEHYFEDPFEWRNRKVRGTRTSLLRAPELNRMSREIAHITYERAAFTEGGSKWPSFAIYVALADVMTRFATAVDPTKVVSDFQARVDAAMPFPEAPRPPAVPPSISVPSDLSGVIASATSAAEPLS